MKKILVIAAHADDEVLGCAGSMARHNEEGDEVRVVLMTDGVGARGEGREEEIQRRSGAMQKALGCLGVTLLEQYQLPDNAMDSLSRRELIQTMEDTLLAYAPDIVYTHHGGDLNIDHRRCLEAVLTIFRPQPHCRVESIMSFEVASSTGWGGYDCLPSFVPNHYIDISKTLDAKKASLLAYAEEMRAFPHARSYEALEHLARFRGSQVGVKAAEAFVVQRLVRY